jgi:hypothetical protein
MLLEVRSVMPIGIFCSLGENDTLFAIVDAVDFTLGCDCGQLVDGSPATTTHINDGVVARYRDVLQTTVC